MTSWISAPVIVARGDRWRESGWVIVHEPRGRPHDRDGEGRQAPEDPSALTMLVALTIVFLVVTGAAAPLFSVVQSAPIGVAVLIALLVPAIPTAIAGLLGIGGRRGHMSNVRDLGRAVESHGDVVRSTRPAPSRSAAARGDLLPAPGIPGRPRRHPAASIAGELLPEAAASWCSGEFNLRRHRPSVPSSCFSAQASAVSTCASVTRTTGLVPVAASGAKAAPAAILQACPAGGAFPGALGPAVATSRTAAPRCRAVAA